MAAKRKIIAKKKTKARRKKRVVAKPARRRAPGATKRKTRKKAKRKPARAPSRDVVAALHRSHGVIFYIGNGWTKSRADAVLLSSAGAAKVARSYASSPALKVVGTFSARDSAATIGSTLRSKS